MRNCQRDDLMMCIGKMRGILSMLEFDGEEEDSMIVHDRLYETLQDMEMIVKEVDIHDRGFCERDATGTEDSHR